MKIKIKIVKNIMDVKKFMMVIMLQYLRHKGEFKANIYELDTPRLYSVSLIIFINYNFFIIDFLDFLDFL